MIKLYKLTDRDGQTRNGTQWGHGVSHSGTGEGELCGPGWIHAYEHPLIAVLVNPIHANIQNPRLWEAEGEVGLRDGQIKCGCKTLTTIREIPLPSITTEMRVRFAILCAREALTAADAACKAWNAWADKWLSGEDRSAAAAAKAAAAAAKAVYDATGAARAAYDAAAWAAEAAEAAAASAYAAYRASWAAARSVQWAAKAAASAAYRASLAAACCGMDLSAIAEKACAVSRE